MNEKKTQLHLLPLLDFEKEYIVQVLKENYDSGKLQEIERDEIPRMAEHFLAGFYGMIDYSVSQEEFDEEQLMKAIFLFVTKFFG